MSWMAIICLFAAMTELGTGVVSAAEKKPADFFKGATIRIVVPFAPGGTADTATRVPVAFFGKYSGARVVVENMPGAGGYVALRYLYHSARPDGLTLGMLNPSGIYLAELLGEKEITWKLENFSFIGRAIRGSGGVLMVGKPSPIRTLDDLIKAKRQVKAATVDPTIGSSVKLAMSAEALDLNLKIVPGFPGGKAQVLAVLKGEIEMTCNPPAGFENEFKTGELRALAIACGRDVAPAFRSLFSSLPRLMDLPLRREKKRFVELATSLDAVGFVLAGPPRMTEDRVRFLENAWLKALSEPEVKRTFEMRGDFYEPMSGKDYLQLLKEIRETVTDIGTKDLDQIMFKKYY